MNGKIQYPMYVFERNGEIQFAVFVPGDDEAFIPFYHENVGIKSLRRTPGRIVALTDDEGELCMQRATDEEWLSFQSEGEGVWQTIDEEGVEVLRDCGWPL